jgi:pimeloyl-ACP methyl ester carboxylesterase
MTTPTGRELRRIVPTRFGQIHLRAFAALRADSAMKAARPLVLLHMSPRSSEMWLRLQRTLPRATLAPDRLGYGFSDAPSRDLSMAEYATATLEALDAQGIDGEFDVIGMHTGALEAIELAHLAPRRVGNLGLVAIPIFDAADRERGLSTFARMRVEPSEDGAHLQTAWRGRFAYRQPPWDLADVQRRLVDYLLAPRPGHAYRAVFGYDAAPRLQNLGRPVIAFAPRDDVHEVTVRSRPLLPVGSSYVDMPQDDIDFLRTRTAEFAALIERYFP